MTKAQLTQIQAPLKERYRLNPSSAQVRLTAKAVLGPDITCTSKIGPFNVKTEMHHGVGGPPNSICPATLLLDSLAACAGIVMGAVATNMSLPVRSATIGVEGDLDLRGTLGIDEGALVGFKEIRISVDLCGDMSKQEMATLLGLVEKYCVVSQTLARPPKISFQLLSGS